MSKTLMYPEEFPTKITVPFLALNMRMQDTNPKYG